jgi:4-amino-4-deoxy-L-arabinose transferase-like glycosyltransferase
MEPALRPVVNARSYGFLAFLFFWVLILRAPMFLVSAVDWDEGLYVLMASQWLDGHPPYTTVFEGKPIGIFAIFAAALGVLGDSVTSIRLVTVAAVYLTALSLFLIAKRFFRSVLAGVVAAISYPVLTLGLQGLSSNTELFFIFFNVLGLQFLLVCTSDPGLGRRKASLYALAAGLSFGAAVQIKYIVALEIVLFVAYHVLARYRSLRHAPAVLAMLALGGALPSVLATLYLWMQGVIDLFLVSNFEVNRRYAAMSTSEDIWNGLKHAAQDWFKWTWVTLIAVVFLRLRVRQAPNADRILGFLLLWLAIGVAEASLTLKFYKHYFLVTLPPLCLLLGHASARFHAGMGDRRTLIAALMVALGFPVVRTLEKTYVPWVSTYLTEGDVNVNIARYLKELISRRDYIYVVNGQPIIYFLTKARLPTRYVFPPHILSEPINRVINVDYPREVERIFDKAPRAVLIRDNKEEDTRVREIEARVQREYVVGTRIGDTSVYIRKPRSGESEANE